MTFKDEGTISHEQSLILDPLQILPSLFWRDFQWCFLHLWLCYLGGLPDPKGRTDQCCFMAMLRLCWPGIGPLDQHPNSTWKPIFWKGELYPSCIPRTYISLEGSTELPRVGPSKVVVSSQNKLSAIYLTAWNLYSLLPRWNLESLPSFNPKSSPNLEDTQGKPKV